MGRFSWKRSLRRLLGDATIAQACAEQARRMEPPNAAPERVADLVEGLAPGATGRHESGERP
jgi:hypothetical protein